MNFAPVILAYQSLLRQKRRSLLTMLAIAIGIAAVITIMGAGKGMQRFVLGQLDVFGPDTFNIETRVPNSKKNSSGFGSVGITITSLKERDLSAILKLPNILAAYGMVNGQEAVSYQGQIKKVALMGHGAGMLYVDTFTIDLGRFYTQDEEDSLAQVAVLGATAKEKLFGDEDPIDKLVYIRGKPFRVIGAMGKRGSAFFLDMDNQITLPAKTMQKKLLGIDYYQMIIGKMRDGSRADQTALEVAEVIRSNHSITNSDRDDFAVNTTADARKTLTTVTGGVTMLLVALVCISLIVGGVGIMNIMYVSVAERTFEIGLRKSLGARSKDILLQFLAEAVLITLGGGVVGVVLGTILAFIIYIVAVSFNFKWVFSVPLSSIALAVGFSATIGLLFGLYPAKKAAALSPIDALRRE